MTAESNSQANKGAARSLQVSLLALAAFMAMLSTSHAASTEAYGGPLRQAAVLSSASNDAQAFLRFYNAGSFSGHVTVSLADSVSGQTLGQWTSPETIAPGTAQQYPVYTIESALPKGTALPKYYSVTVQSQFAGTFQYALWTPSKRTITNLSRCDSGITTVPTRVANVHSSILNAYGFASTVVVYNTGTSAAAATLAIYNALTGQLVDTYTTAAIPPAGQLSLAISAIESARNITPSTTHYVISFQGLFSGYLQHLLGNADGALVTDMSTVCTLPAP